MSAVLALALMVAQPVPQNKDKPVPKDKDKPVRPEPKLDPFVAKVTGPDPKDTPLRKLQKERCRERATAIAIFKDVIEIGSWPPSYYTEYVKLQVTLSENLAEMMDTPADRMKCYEMRRDAMKEWERYVETRVVAGDEHAQSLHIAKANRIDAEIELLKLKAEIEKAGKK